MKNNPRHKFNNIFAQPDTHAEEEVQAYDEARKEGKIKPEPTVQEKSVSFMNNKLKD